MDEKKKHSKGEELQEDFEMEQDYDYLTLEFDGEEVECAVIDEFELDGKKYIVLYPDEEEDAYIYRYEENEAEEIELFNLEEEEFTKAVSEFNRRSEIDE